MMTTRPTPLACAILTLAGSAIVLGMLAARPALFIAAVPLLVALWSARHPGTLPAMSLELDVSPLRAIEGKRVILDVRVTSDVSIALVELLIPMPAILGAAPVRWITSFEQRQEFQQRAERQATMSGRAPIATVMIRLSDATGLWTHDMEVQTAAEAVVYPQVIALRHIPRPARSRAAFGNHVSTQPGEGIEPAEVRPFVAGDLARHINWPASLRRQQLYVTQFNTERSADVILLVDTFAVAGVRPRSTLDACSRAAAALAVSCIARRDRVGMIELGGYLRWLRPRSGRAQLDRVLGTILPSEVVFTYVSHRLDYVPRAALPPQALVIAVTPLIDARFENATLDLVHRGYQVVILAVDSLAFMRDALPKSRLSQTALRLWALERERHVRALRRRGVPVVEWDPDQPLAAALARHAWPPRSGASGS
ncbi:DUF58 domain-containing protein [Paraburkholderia fungorum]|uniref:DUF58 domain-containing protein n=1 Tax=Paraburkholderia fungorum TaxID=134537 RepID=UPI00402BDD5C